MVRHISWSQYPCMLQVRMDGEEMSPEVLWTLQVLQDPGHLDTALVTLTVMSAYGIISICTHSTLSVMSAYCIISTFTHHYFFTRLLPIGHLPIRTFTHHLPQLANRLLPIKVRHLPISLVEAKMTKQRKGN